MYAVFQKGRHQTHNGKFANSQPIFRTFFTVKFSSKLAKYLLKIPLQRLKRFGYISTCYTVSELIVNCDHDLFTKATRYGHWLHHLVYSQLLALLTIFVLVAIHFSCILP